MKKLLPLAGLCLLVSAGLNGDYNSSGGANKASGGCCPPAPKTCCPPPTCGCPCDEEAYGMPGQCLNMAFLPPAGPRVACGVDMFISADFIYWTAREDGLGYAATNWASADDINAVPPTSISKGSVKHPDFGFSPGFKVDLGLMLDHDGWDVKAQYTWLFTGDEKDRTSEEDADSSRLGANWFSRRPGPQQGSATSLSQPDFPRWTSADTKWDLHFQVIDLNLGRNFFVSQYLSMRPHFGFKGTWQKQKYTNSYALVETDTETMRISQELDYWGFGIRTGFETAWYFTQSWAIYGNVALSALWSQFEVCRRDRSDDVADDDTEAYTNFYTENDFHTILPVLELGIGLRWEMWSCDDAYHFQIQAGWEEQVWWKMNQFYGIYEEGNHGDLNLQGFTLHFRFGF